MTNPTTSAFNLPGRLAAKADPALIADDEQHFAAIAASLDESMADLSERLQAELAAPGGIGQKAGRVMIQGAVSSMFLSCHSYHTGSATQAGPGWWVTRAWMWTTMRKDPRSCYHLTYPLRVKGSMVDSHPPQWFHSIHKTSPLRTLEF